MASIPSAFTPAAAPRSPAQPAAPAIKPKLLKVEEVCRRIGFGQSKLRALIRSGRFPRPVRVGAAVRWVIEEVDTWIDEQIAARDQAIGSRR